MHLCPKRQAVRSAGEHGSPMNAMAMNRIIHRLHLILLSLCAIHTATAFLSSTTPTLIVSRGSGVIEKEQTAALSFSSTSQNALSTKASQNSQSTKAKLLDIFEKAPRNAPTSASLTAEILSVVRELEGQCPTPDADVQQELAGVWELLWTTQDRSRPESQSLFAWINPLENQSYSNNPGGRSNPVLPRQIQDALEQVGIINTSTKASNTSGTQSGTVRSTQSINLAKREVRNVVGFALPKAWPHNQQPRASITLKVKFRPNPTDLRMIDVKFQRCRVRVSNAFIPIDVKIPFGYIGPTGWLRTGYIDDDLRITRGHKGSVFILSRRASKKLKH
jgi:hypothetical protein